MGGDFSAAQMGYIVSLQNGINTGPDTENVIKDCVRVILNEGMLSESNNENLSLDDWTSKIKNIANAKKGE